MGQTHGSFCTRKWRRKDRSIPADKGARATSRTHGASKPGQVEQHGEVSSSPSGSSGAVGNPGIRNAGLHAGGKSMSSSSFAGSQDSKHTHAASGSVSGSNRGSGIWLQCVEEKVNIQQPAAKVSSKQPIFESCFSSSGREYHDASHSALSSQALDAPQHTLDIASSSSSASRECLNVEMPCVEAGNQQLRGSGLVAETLSSLPVELRPKYQALAVLQPDAALPMSAMQLVWEEPQVECARSLAERLKQRGVLKLATLEEDDSVWCLVAKEHLQQLQAACASQSAASHASLLSAYTRHGQLPWVSVPDDGYILKHLAHHMLAAGQHDQLQALLLDPSWLQLKLGVYGASAVVSDLQCCSKARDGPLVQLLLLALQASVAGCSAHADVTLLRAQLVARLMGAAQHLPELKAWHQEQLQRCISDAARDSKEGTATAMLLATPSLAQTGGRQRLQLRHQPGAAVTRVALTCLETKLISASDDGTLVVWDMGTGDCRKQARVTSSAITAMVVMPDGHMCIVGSATGELCVWNLQADELAHKLMGHTDRINALVVESSCWRVATASSDGSARLWGIDTADCQFVLTGHGSDSGGAGLRAGLGVVWDCAFSSDSTMLGTVSDDFTARIWDTSTGQCLHVLEGHSSSVVGCVFVPGTHTFVSASHDGTARVWDAQHASLKHVLTGHTGRITRVRAFKQGHLVITASDDYTVCTWDTDTGCCVSQVDGHTAWTDSEACASMAPVVATTGGDGSLAVWDPCEGVLLDTLSGHTGVIIDACFSHKARFVITASGDSTMRVWDRNAPADKGQDKHVGKVKCLRLLGGGKTIASIGEDCVLRIWDVDTYACNSSWTGHRTGLSWVFPCSSGRRVITASADRQVCSLNLERGELTVACPPQQGSRVKSIAMDAGARMAAVALYDSTVSLCWLDSGEAEQEGGSETLIKNGTMQQLIKKGDLDGVNSHSGGVNAVYVTSDGKAVLTVSKDATCRVWDVAALECRLVLEGHEDSINCAALSPDDRFVATTSYDKTTRYWCLQDGKCLSVVKHSASASHLCISPNGNVLACVTDDHIVTLCRVPSCQQKVRFAAHTATVNGVAFTPDSVHVLTFADDCSLKVWDAQSGTLCALFAADDAICTAIALHSVVVAGDAAGRVHFLPFPLRNITHQQLQKWEYKLTGAQVTMDGEKGPQTLEAV